MKTIFLLLFVSISPLFSQNNCSISGKIIFQNKPISKIEVILLKNNIEVQRNLSSLEGIFIFDKLNIDTFNIVIKNKTYNGYKSNIIVNSNNCIVNIGEIALNQKKISIQEISIAGNRPTIKQEIGKMTLDASKVTIQQGTLQDLITQMPGVSVDNNSNVTYNGKSGLRILVDGKMSLLAESDMKSFMNSIQASSVQSVQIQNNPDAKYEAEGKGGLIVINLKKNKKSGFNTKINANIGTPLNKYNAGGLFNFKKGKVNLFGSYNFLYRDMYYTYYEDRTLLLPTETSYYTQDMRWKNITRGHNAKAGIDYDLDEKNSFNFTFDMNSELSNGGNNAINKAYLYDENKNLTQRLEVTNTGLNKSVNTQFSSAYKHIFDTTGKEIQVDAVYTALNATNNNINENLFYNPTGFLLKENYYYYGANISNKVNYFMNKVDVSLPSKIMKWNFGIKNEYTINDNELSADTNVYGGTPAPSSRFYNQFNYKEWINAAYTTHQFKLGKTQVDLGLRVERTDISSNNSEVTRNYFNIFPNVGLEYELDSQSTFSAKYSRRIQRPSFSQLNNRVIFYSKYTANFGDPKLQPSFSDVVSFMYTLQSNGFMPYFTLGADMNLDYSNIQEVNFIDSNLVNYFGNGNIGKSNIFTLSSSMQFVLNQSIQLMVSPSYSFSNFQNYRKNAFERSFGNSVSLFANLNVSLPADIKLSLNSWMNTNMVWAQGTTEFFGAVNGSISKSFLNKKLNVEISCQDILNTNTWIGHQNTSTLQFIGRWKPETRIAYLNISYLLGGNVKERQIEKNNRISTGGGR
jgi:hypothetical protein